MKKTKTNISVVNNAGIRRNASVHVGKQGPFPSGDILDANAIQEMIDDDSLAVSAALNDLNSRVGSGGGIGEDEELIISTALNDLNARIEGKYKIKVMTVQQYENTFQDNTVPGNQVRSGELLVSTMPDSNTLYFLYEPSISTTPTTPTTEPIAL